MSDPKTVPERTHRCEACGVYYAGWVKHVCTSTVQATGGVTIRWNCQ